MNWCAHHNLNLLLQHVGIADKKVTALHAMYLVRGYTILSITIRFGTMKSYLHAAAVLSTNTQLMDLHLNIHRNAAELITKVLQEQKQ